MISWTRSSLTWRRFAEGEDGYERGGSSDCGARAAHRARRPPCAGPRVGRHRRPQASRGDVRRRGPRVLPDRGPRGKRDPLAAGRGRQRRRLAAGLQPALHRARDHDGLPGRHPDRVRVCQLPGAAHDRRPRPGVSEAERVWILGLPVRGLSSVLQLSGRGRPLRRRLRPRRGLVRVCAAHRASLLAGEQHRLLEPLHPRDGIRDGRDLHQSHHHDPHHALPRDEPRAHAPLCLDDAGGLRHDGAGPAAAVRRPDHAAARSFPRRTLLRHAGRGIRGHVAALLLVLRPPRGLHPHGAGLRHGLRDHPRLLAQGDLRLSDGGGRIRFATPMLFACAFLFQFLCAGLTGIILSVVPFNWQLTDSYFVVAHFHFVLVGSLIFTVFGAIYYWFPKVTGRILSERLGRWHFWLFVIGFNLTFLPMHWAGMLGMPRRIYTYPADRGWDFWNLLSSLGVPFQAAAVLIFLVNVAISVQRGERAGSDPWDAWTLEWATASPPPAYNFETAPVVESRRPLWDLKHPDDPDGPHE